MDSAVDVRSSKLAPQDPTPTGMKRSAMLSKVADLERSKQGPQTVLQDIQRFVLPFRGRFNTETQEQRGKRRDLSVINGTAMRSFSVLSSGMMAGLTSPGRPWFKLGIAQDPDLAEYTPVRTWLDDVARSMRGLFARSNLYNVLPSTYQEIGGFGTSALLEVADPQSVIRFVPFTIGSYAIAMDDRLIVDTFSRKYNRTVRQVVGRFGTDKVSESTLNSWKRHNLENDVQLVHIIYANPNQRGGFGPDSMPYIEEYWELGGDRQEPLYRGGYQERALFVPRWDVAGDDLWGTGLGHQVLGDVKQLQFLERRKEDVLEKHTAPPLEASAELRGKRISLLSGDISYTNPQQTGGASIRPIVQTLPAAYQYTVQDINEKEAKIRSALFEDLFLMLSNDTRSGITAREVEERHQEKMLVLGPVLERLNEELFDPLVDRTYAIMERQSRAMWNGQIRGNPMLPPPPQELQGTKITVEYTSILAQASKATNTRGIEAFGMFVGQLAQVFGPSVMDKVNTDQMVDEYADAQGIPARIVRGDEEVEEMRASRAQQEQMNQMAQMAQPAAQMASAMKDLASTAPVENNLAQSLGGAMQ